MKISFLIILLILTLTIDFASAARGKSEFKNYKRRLLRQTIKQRRENFVKWHNVDKIRLLQSTNVTVPPPSYNILVSPWLPMMSCTPGDYNQTHFTGFTFDVWSLLSSELNWPTSDYVFECLPPDALAARLLTGNNATLGDGAIRITQDKINQGFKFAQPYYQSGLNVVIRKNVARSMWSFMKPITLPVGLGFIASTIIVGVFIWVFEERNWRRHYKEHVLNFVEVIYDVFSSYYETNSIELKTVAARITQWTFWFNVIIFVALYQADLTGQLSSNYYTQDFATYQEGVSQGRVFGTLDYLKTMSSSILTGNLQYYDTKADVNGTVTQMFQDLIMGNVDGLIIDEPLAIYYAAQYCDLLILSDVIYEFNYAPMFPPNTPDSFILQVSSAITKLLETQQLRLIKKQDFEAALNTNCDSGETKISMNELAGLWVILACTIFIALIIYVVKRLKLVSMPESYMPPYYAYFTPKTQLFENQLKEAVEFEVGKILASYQEQIMEEIENFERSLLLQEEKEKAKDDVVDLPDRKPDKKWSLFKVKTMMGGDATPKTPKTPKT
jgi:ABC-type amino acid transport substrate-binding protein